MQTNSESIEIIANQMEWHAMANKSEIDKRMSRTESAHMQNKPVCISMSTALCFLIYGWRRRHTILKAAMSYKINRLAQLSRRQLIRSDMPFYLFAPLLIGYIRCDWTQLGTDGPIRFCLVFNVIFLRFDFNSDQMASILLLLFPLDWMNFCRFSK